MIIKINEESAKHNQKATRGVYATPQTDDNIIKLSGHTTEHEDKGHQTACHSRINLCVPECRPEDPSQKELDKKTRKHTKKSCHIL